MADVLASTEARDRLPKLIEQLVEHPDDTVEVGRQRRREVVLMSAARYDELVETLDAQRDLAWVLFAQERVENPTSEPVTWEDAQRRRRRA